MAASLFFPAVSGAQGTSNTQTSNTLTQADAAEASMQLAEKDLRATAGDPAEDAAFKAFQSASLQDVDKKIQLGNKFINKYPSSIYDEMVYAGLAQAYYAKQDLPNFYATVDKGIALNPDDMTLLAMTGWVIPRVYKADDPDADQKLDKAERYEKHVIETMDTLAKPANIGDQQFAQYKTTELATAHSGLGLVYFREGKFEVSAKELQQATQGGGTLDATDLFVLGYDLQKLNRYSEAVDAFNRCAQIAGGMQNSCKQGASTAMSQAAQAK